MFSQAARRSRVLFVLCFVIPFALAPASADDAKRPQNMLANPGFELGRDGWNLGKGGKTTARFTIDKSAAYSGQFSGLITVENVEDWGTQFGQNVEGGSVGKTYTFAAVAKSTKGPVDVRLEIERNAKPWDRAARSDKVTLKPDAWTELHITFKLDKPFSEGWFAYISCNQPNAEYRLDACRLYEGEFIPYDQAAREEKRAAGVTLFDTAAPPADPFSGWMNEQRGWIKLAEDDTSHNFKGDAVLLNDRMAVVFRRGSPWADLFVRNRKEWVSEASLVPLMPDGLKAETASVTIVENTPTGATVDVTVKHGQGHDAVLRYELSAGQTFVRTEARAGVTALRLLAMSSYVILPDFFADDMVIDPREIPVDRIELPSENFLLHLLHGEDAMLLTVSNSRERDARIELGSLESSPLTEGAQSKPVRVVRGSEVYYGKDKQIWVAVLEGRGIWHEHAVARQDADKIIPLDWKAPYPAQWRIDWRRADKLTSSWEMLTQLQGGEFEKPGWFGGAQRLPADRKRWTTVLGSFKYPCWIDRTGQGCLQPLKNRAVEFEGPALIYPINRIAATPLREFTVVDVMRATMGVGPCEYVLDVEGQGQANKGRATCGTRDLIGAIYRSGEQKKKRAEVLKALDDVVIFVKHIRGRIEEYQAFGHELLAYLDVQKRAHPELADFVAEMQTLTRNIDAGVDKRKTEIKNPQYVVDLTQKFRDTLLDYEGADAPAKCKAITEAIVVVGGNQDELVGECRMAVRILRQRAGLAMAVEPRTAEIAREIRRRSQAVLRNATGYEAPRQ